MIGIEIINGQGIVTLPGVVLVMTKRQFIDSLRRSIAEERHELAAREQAMGHHG
jgi:hypothetical protein